MHTKSNDGIFVNLLGIMKNVVIQFIKEHWGPTLSTVRDGILIFEVKLKLRVIFRNFQNGRHFELTTNFFYRKWYRKLNIPDR